MTEVNIAARHWTFFKLFHTLSTQFISLVVYNEPVMFVLFHIPVILQLCLNAIISHNNYIIIIKFVQNTITHPLAEV